MKYGIVIFGDRMPNAFSNSGCQNKVSVLSVIFRHELENNVDGIFCV